MLSEIIKKPVQSAILKTVLSFKNVCNYFFFVTGSNDHRFCSKISRKWQPEEMLTVIWTEPLSSIVNRDATIIDFDSTIIVWGKKQLFHNYCINLFHNTTDG